MTEKTQHVAEIENDRVYAHTFLVTNCLFRRKGNCAWQAWRAKGAPGTIYQPDVVNSAAVALNVHFVVMAFAWCEVSSPINREWRDFVMQPISSHPSAHSPLNHHPVRSGLVGGILGGLASGLVVGVPLFVLGILLTTHTSEGLSSAHGMSIGEIAIFLLLGSFLLAPLCALAGCLGGAIAGMSSKSNLVNIAVGVVCGAVLIGVLAAVWLVNSGSGSLDLPGEVLAFCLGAVPGAVGGGIGAAIGTAVRYRLGTN